LNIVMDAGWVDRPNSYIGKSVPRPNAKNLVEGRGQYVDDIVLSRMVHVAFLRSPHAHATILAIDAGSALEVPGVLRVFTGRDLTQHCEPWVATLAHLKGMKSAPQRPLPPERVTWVGEAIAAVVAESRAAAEDAAARVRVDYEPLPAVVDMESALLSSTPVIHAELGDNLCFQRARSTKPSPAHTRLSRLPSTAAGIRASPSSRARLSPTTTARRAGSPSTMRRKRRT